MVSICSFVPFLADLSLRSSGERAPVETRMQDYIPKNWFLCKTGGQVSTNVWDQETSALKQSPTTLTASRAMEHRDGTSSQGEWYGLILSVWNVADFLFSQYAWRTHRYRPKGWSIVSQPMPTQVNPDSFDSQPMLMELLCASCILTSTPNLRTHVLYTYTNISHQGLASCPTQ